LTGVQGHAHFGHAEVIGTGQLQQVGAVGGVASDGAHVPAAQSAVHVEGGDHDGRCGGAHALVGGGTCSATAHLAVELGVSQCAAQRTSRVVNVQCGTGLLVHCGAGCGVGAQPFGLLTATGRTNLQHGLEATHAGCDVADAVGTCAADSAVAPQVGDFAADHAFRGVGEAAQCANFINGGVLVASTDFAEATFDADISLAVGALAIATGGTGVKLVGGSGKAVVLNTRGGSAHAKQSAVGGADALLGHEAGRQTAAEVFRATETNA